MEGTMNEQVTEIMESQEVQVEEVSGLPSDVEETQQQKDINTWDSLVQADPDYMKQFKSLQDFKDKYKQLHNQYSNTVREQKEKERANQTEAQKIAQQQEEQQKQNEVVMELVPEFMQNNMQLTPEMEKKLVENGLDIRDVKLGAIELRERIQGAHELVGGKEEYQSMIEWAKTTLSEDERNMFDKDVTGNMSKFAIKGLYAEFKQAVGSSEPQDRIRGTSTPSTIKPYATKDEILRDRAYLNSVKGRADAVAQKRHKERLNATPDNVIF